MHERKEERTFLFGDFRFEVLEGSLNTLRLLYRQGNPKPLKLQPKSLEVLECLLCHAGKKLSRDAICLEVWRVVKGDLDVHIRAIRRVLKDDPEHPRYIESVRGYGFIFVAEVRGPSEQGAKESQHSDRILSDEEIGRFEEFFGPGTAGASNSSPRAVIVVQAEHTDKVVEAINVDRNAEFKKRPGNRAYKARMWVNYNDLLGAQAIIRLFDSHRLQQPQLVLSAHYDREDRSISPAATLLAAMGLGFTDRSARAFALCQAWMRVVPDSEAGDAIALHEKLVLPNRNAADPKTLVPPNRSPADLEKLGFFPAHNLPGFWERRPRDWSNTYLDNWDAWHRNNSQPPVEDYAIILRHTNYVRTRKQVLFVLAGFTERGTAVAGRYLAFHWRRLSKRYVHDKDDDGDFLIFIVGPSDPGLFRDWEEDEQFAITPLDVYEADIKGCAWFDRVTSRLGPRSRYKIPIRPAPE
jgi:DNA-binding winged helix-turn-helix (wHTH) protein